MKNKDYCVEYIDGYIVSFLRVIFKKVHFNELFDYLINMQKDKNSFKLIDIKDLVEEAFSSNNSDLMMLQSALLSLKTEENALS